MSEYTYVSPLLVEWDESKSRLSLALLSELLPAVREGEEAKELLVQEGSLSSVERERYASLVRAGENAKERLFLAALPLIRLIATKEWRRRQQWSSKVSVEDLIQEATVGFLKGLSSFNLDAMRSSSTNYLGQWMLVEVRRAAESLDHDMQVGHEAGERFRKIRAIRSRLVGELGREPTDQEIVDASTDSSFVSGGTKLGRVADGGRAPKGVTLDQVAEERNTRGRVGHVPRFGSIEDNDSGAGGGAWQVDLGRVSSTSTSKEGFDQDPADVVSDMVVPTAFADLLAKLFNEIGLGEEQRLIISMRYGLPPHKEAMSARKISNMTKVHRERVSKVLAAFTAEMSLPNGHFHRILSTMPEEDVEAVNMAGVLYELGECNMKHVAPVPVILTESKMKEKNKPIPHGESTSDGVIAWFECEFHKRYFAGMYPDRNRIPQRRACPACNRPSPLRKVETP